MGILVGGRGQRKLTQFMSPPRASKAALSAWHRAEASSFTQAHPYSLLS